MCVSVCVCVFVCVCVLIDVTNIMYDVEHWVLDDIAMTLGCYR